MAFGHVHMVKAKGALFVHLWPGGVTLRMLTRLGGKYKNGGDHIFGGYLLSDGKATRKETTQLFMGNIGDYAHSLI